MLYVAIISYTYILLSNVEVKGVLKNDSLYLHLERNESLSLSRQYFMFMLTFLFHKKCYFMYCKEKKIMSLYVTQ